MPKFYSELESNVAYAKQKFRKELKSRRSHGNRLTKRRRKLNSFRPIKKPDFITFDIPPVDFTLLDNNEDVIHYFESTRRHMKRNIYTRMDLSKIKHIDLPALCLLSAFMLDKPYHARFLEVIVPSTGPVGQLFSDAQFEKMIVRDQQSSFTNGGFLSRSDKNVNEKYIEAILDRSAAYFGTGSSKKLRNLSPILTEIFTNTSNHANPKKKNTKLWLINTRERLADGKKHKEYCVVDLGVGIYESVSKKTDQWLNDRKKPIAWMADIGGRSQNSFLRRHIPTGLQSTTALPERGKGVKFIYETAKATIYKRFEIITNRAQVNLLDLSKRRSDTRNSFQGTIYYWEICIG